MSGVSRKPHKSHVPTGFEHQAQPPPPDEIEASTPQ
jgi:hypothetical protein